MERLVPHWMRMAAGGALLLLAQSVARADSIRAVSLAPNLTELVFALGLGDRLIGRSSACDFPPEALELPVVGGFGRPNLELLLRLRPDLVLMTDLENPVTIEALRHAGLRCHVLPCEGWDQLLEAALTIGGELGAPSAGTNWVASMQARKAGLEERTRTFWAGRERPSVYVEVWYDPLTAAGGGSFLDDVVELAGGRNVGHEMKDSYAHISSEWVIRENPDVILAAYMLPTVRPREHIGARAGWGGMKAVRSGAICDTIDPDWLLRSGPRLLDGAEAFAAWLRQRAERDSAPAKGGDE